eukprot:GHRR01027538.1.p2 GENE.GHRR01027538.1~~GHRR01027538.1.p2  ORF type:complete len:119 (+),score=29.37 GHRR01027538.1:970-1326(+)
MQLCSPYMWDWVAQAQIWYGAALSDKCAQHKLSTDSQSLDYYMTNYPTEGDKVLGFLDYNVLLTLQLHHIYTAWYFHGSIALLAASLMACTYSTQWPTAKVCEHMGVHKGGLQGQMVG